METTKWYAKRGEQDDLVVSTRVRLARNFEDVPFPCRITPSGREEVERRVCAALLHTGEQGLPALGVYEPGAIHSDARRAMAERHLLSREFAESGRQRTLLLSEDESVCLLLCDCDHVRLQVMAAGLELSAAAAAAKQLDDLIAAERPYAFSNRWGYLTESPTDLGTGLKASVLLHLPALEATGGIEALAKAVGKIGLSFSGTFGEGSGVSGSLYQLSNQITMGIEESAVLENLRSVTLQLIAQEKDARKALSPLSTEDAAYRALGLLQNARILTVREFTDALSRLRLGISMGLIENVSLQTLGVLNAEMHPATLLLRHPEADSTEKRDAVRAKLVREQLQTQ